ncbi:MAG TPA: copper homeostasis protein CutC [Acidimicrobiales bacterium]|nr:copper homeostasis protein CutC [Acidimicrobiales bacterium]
MRFEVCVESVDGVRAAARAGAHRVELCADLAVGGVTPDLAVVKEALAVADAAASVAGADADPVANGRLGVHVLVRPRGGDFVYSAAEVDVMRRDLAALVDAGVDGVVVGALDPAGRVDLATTRALVDAGRPARVTFHRAFDAAADPLAALEALADLGVDRVLTSGAAPTAADGAGLLARLVEAAGDRLIVLAGGGITDANAAVVAAAGVSELHFSARYPAADGADHAERIRRIMRAARRGSTTPSPQRW